MLFSRWQVDIKGRHASRVNGRDLIVQKPVSGLYAIVLPCSDSRLECKKRPVEWMRCLNERGTASRVRRLGGIKAPSGEGAIIAAGATLQGHGRTIAPPPSQITLLVLDMCGDQIRHLRQRVRTPVMCWWRGSGH